MMVQTRGFRPASDFSPFMPFSVPCVPCSTYASAGPSKRGRESKRERRPTLGGPEEGSCRTGEVVGRPARWDRVGRVLVRSVCNVPNAHGARYKVVEAAEVDDGNPGKWERRTGDSKLE
jgi:hypothetical protein